MDLIITRSPLRISLGGGGTDLPSYYRDHGGFLVAMAMSKYVYVTLHRRFNSGFLLKYSRIEQVTAVDEIVHPIIREALRVMDTRETDLEITSVADVPAGTGLGSSSSFTTALLRGLHIHQRRYIDTQQLAELACHVEIDRVHEPIGKQDQYIAAFGGLTAFTFNADDTVNVELLPISEDTLADLSDNMLLFFTGSTRDASQILREQERQKHSSGSAHERQPSQGKNARLSHARRLPVWAARRVGRNYARALDGEETAVERHVQSSNRRVVRFSSS